MVPEQNRLCVWMIGCDQPLVHQIQSTVQQDNLEWQVHPQLLGFLEVFDSTRSGCAIASIDLPERGAWELLENLRANPPGLHVIILAQFIDAPTAIELMKAGAHDILIQPYSGLARSVQQALELDLLLKMDHAAHAAARRHYLILTPREREIFHMVVTGLPSKAIAQSLSRSQKTVEVHRTSIMKKMGARSVVDLVRIGMELRILKGAQMALEPGFNRSSMSRNTGLAKVDRISTDLTRVQAEA